MPIPDDGGARDDALMYVWEDWEIAAAFKVGTSALGWEALIPSIAVTWKIKNGSGGTAFTT